MISKIYINPSFKSNLQKSPSQTSGLSYNYATPLNKTKPNYLPKDTFQRQKFNPAFGSIIPKNDVIEHIEPFIKKIDEFLDINDLKTTTTIFSENLKNKIHIHSTLGGEIKEGWSDSLEDIVKKTSLEEEMFDEKEKLIYSGYINDIANNSLCALANVCSNTQKDLISMKNELKTIVESVRLCTLKWANLEEWSKNPAIKNQSERVFEILHYELEPFAARTHIDFVAETLWGMKTYGNDELINVSIKEGFQDESSAYYCAYFTNPKAKQMPNEELKKIFSKLIILLEENGFKDDILNLIQKEGSCLCVPLM